MILKKITPQVYLFPYKDKNGAIRNIGVVKGKRGKVVLIDSGPDNFSVKKVLQILAKNNLSVVGIINTHSHADHCWGNQYVVKKTNAKVYSSILESEVLISPLIEPFCFFSGAFPIKELRSSFFESPGSSVDVYLSRKNQIIKIAGISFKIIGLPGHSFNHIGVIIDDVLFCGDSVYSREAMSKHKIPFHVNIENVKKTLKMLARLKCQVYIMSHSSPVNSLNDLIRFNLNYLKKIEDQIINILKKPTSTENVIQQLSFIYGVNIKKPEDYYLFNTKAMAYLSYLYNYHKIKIIIKNNHLLW